MKLQILVENTVYVPEAKAEHGFSLYVETDDNRKILFDTGQTGLFAENARIFGIDISQIDALVLSHGHYDHTGGLKRFLELNSSAQIFAKEGFGEEKYNRSGRYVGFPKNLKISSERLCMVHETMEIAKNVFAVPQIKIFDKEETHFKNLFVKKNGVLQEDTFEDEMFLTFMQNGKISVASGCAHRGILNIIQSAAEKFSLPIDLVVGGFHTAHEDKNTICRFAQKLKTKNIARLVPCHCTGIEQYAVLKSHYDGEMVYGFVGLALNV